MHMLMFPSQTEVINLLSCKLRFEILMAVSMKMAPLWDV
jgi:hypothetical protein